MSLPNHSRCDLSAKKIGAYVPMHLLIVGCSLLALAAQKAPVTSALQSKESDSGITTQVLQDKEHGEPSEEEQRHISVLGTQLLHQIARARYAIDADDREAAETAIGKARQALKIIRQMLPKSVITTTVINAQAEPLYEDTEEVQANSVTVLRAFMAVDIVRPLIASKKEAAAEAGEEFEAGAVVETDVVVDLGLVERRLAAAQRALSKDLAAADEALAEAQQRGTTLNIVAMESPLDEAREALEFAHAAVTRKEYRAAEANLRIARGYLTLYREMAPDADKQAIDTLNKEIDSTSQQITSTTPPNHETTSKSITSMLNRVKTWWRGTNATKTSPDPATKSPTPSRR